MEFFLNVCLCLIVSLTVAAFGLFVVMLALIVFEVWKDR